MNNWDSLCTIYSKDHATGEGARTGAEGVQEPQNIPEDTPEAPPKKKRTGDAILCMMGEVKMTFEEAMKSTEPLPMPKVTPPTEILDALKKVPDLEDSDMVRAYGKLIVNERLVKDSWRSPLG